MTSFTKRPGFEREVTGGSNILDSSNSSTAVLASSGVFTGDWVDASGFSDVIVSVSTDQDGTYSVQFSPDGTNVDSTLTRYYRTDQINVPHRFTITRRYFRVVFTNTSASSQTYFRLQTHYGSYSNLNTPIDSTMSQDFDAIAVRPTDIFSEVVLGTRQGYNAFLKFGYNDDVDNSSAEVVASFGGTFTPLSTASTLDIVSSDANDTNSSGTGARSIFITGVDANREFQFEFVNLNGASTVTTSNTWLGVNRMVVYTSGSSETNEGDITATATTGGSNQAQIPAGTGVTQQLIFFNQDGHQALIKQITLNCLKLSGGSSPRVTFFVNVWNPKTTDSTYVIRRFKLDTATSNDIVREFDIPIKLDPTDVLWVTCETNTNNTSVDGEIDIVEVKQAST